MAPEGAAAAARCPAVVFVNGYGSADDAYFWAAQDLAEHGYLVMTFDPQGAGGSDAKPAPEFCEPGGAWTQPQEMGIREQGSCAGQDPDDTPLREAEGLTFVATGKVGNEDTRGTRDRLPQDRAALRLRHARRGRLPAVRAQPVAGRRRPRAASASPGTRPGRGRR